MGLRDRETRREIEGYWIITHCHLKEYRTKRETSGYWFTEGYVSASKGISQVEYSCGKSNLLAFADKFRIVFCHLASFLLILLFDKYIQLADKLAQSSCL